MAYDSNFRVHLVLEKGVGDPDPDPEGSRCVGIYVQGISYGPLVLGLNCLL